MKKLLLYCLFIMILCGCGVNYYAARQIRKNYPKEYTGIDTLININGFYYKDCDIDFCNPSVFKTNGAFYRIGGGFFSMTDIYNSFKRLKPTDNQNGHYIISGDTIVVRYAFRYQPLSYVLHESYFLIIDNNTLQLVKSKFHDGMNLSVREYDHIYKFHAYEGIWK